MGKCGQTQSIVGHPSLPVSPSPERPTMLVLVKMADRRCEVEVSSPWAGKPAGSGTRRSASAMLFRTP